MSASHAMTTKQFIFWLLCIGLLIIITLLLRYFYYRVVVLDAQSRGLPHPHFWSLYLVSNQKKKRSLGFYLLASAQQFQKHANADFYNQFRQLQRIIWLLFIFQLVMIVISLGYLFWAILT
ncbi:hypothetical protein H3R26_01295 [Lactobacillus sp. W8092]|nr:hypothetical protein [Lactobacillus sp. W8092]